MRSRFAYCDQPLPQSPGTSEFHIKGEFYRQLAEVVAHHDQKVGGALLSVLEREGLAEFTSQQFLSSSLYDVLPLPRIVMAIAEVRGFDVHELTTRLGRAAVEGQMKGVYAGFLLRLTTENFVQRFDQVINHFYDFAPVSVTGDGRGARLVRKGIPLCVAEWWSLVTVPFVQVPLGANGAREVKVEWRITPAGLLRGVAVGEVVWDVGWASSTS